MLRMLIHHPDPSLTDAVVHTPTPALNIFLLKGVSRRS